MSEDDIKEEWTEEKERAFKEATGISTEQADKLRKEWGITPNGEWND